MKILFFLSFCFLSCSFIAQNREVDSLTSILKSTKYDTCKIRIYHELYLATDKTYYIKLNLIFSKKKHNDHGMAVSYRDFGRHYFFTSKKDIGLENLNKAVKIALKINDKKTLLSAYRYIGYIYTMNDPILAKEYYFKSLKLAVLEKDFIGESYALSAIGNIYEGMLSKKGNYNIALFYYLKSLKLRENFGDNSEIASSLNETSRIYRYLGNNEKSTKLLFKALKISKESTNLYDSENLVYIYNSIGNDYIYRLKDFKKGVEFELKAFERCKDLPDNIEILFDISKMIAMAYSNLGEIEKGNYFYQKAISYYELIRARTNKYDYNVSSIKHALEDKLSKQNRLLIKSESNRQASLRDTLVIGFLFLLFLFLLILRSYRQNKKSNIELDLKNRKIETNSVVIENQKRIVEENNRQLVKILQEKEILFKEVHHRVKNNLQIISSLLSLQSNTVSDQNVIDVLKQSQSRINTMSILHNKLYQTVDFTNVPINEYLDQLVTSISGSFCSLDCDIKFDIKADPSIILNIDAAIPFGLILNELVTNSFKYAFLNKTTGLIQVSLSKIENEKFKFIYRDNGVGLPINFRELSTQSLGIELIEMLVLQLNGTIFIENDSGAFFNIIFTGNPEKSN